MKIRLFASAMTMMACVAGAADVRGEEPVFERPNFQVLRYNEDWSGLATVDRWGGGDWLDGIKHVPLNDDSSWWASFGGQLRLRSETWRNFAFDGANDDTFVLGRARLHGDFHFGEHVRLFVEGKSALSTDRALPGGRRTLDVDTFALQNGFVDVTLPLEHGGLTVRGGRQELLFGSQRLVSPLDWANTRRTFDGVSVIYEQRPWTLTGFWTRPVEVDKYDFNESDSDTQFYGFYASGEVPFAREVGLDLYALGLSDRAAMYDTIAGGEDRYTLGGRLYGELDGTGFDYDLEGGYQFGRVSGEDVDAYFVASEVGYRFADVTGSPRLSLGLDYASGGRSGDGDVQTFNQLFPLGHAYLGWIDLVGRQNVIAVSPGLTVKPTERLTLMARGHFFWRADEADAVYNAGGGVLRSGGGSDSREVGAELDLKAGYRFTRNLSGAVGYSRFFPGGFIEDTGPSGDVDFFYTTLEFTF